jgi:TonB family protein
MGYPIRATNARQEGVVLLRVQLDNSGQVASSQILQSSGSEVLDQAGLKLTHKLKNLPNPPSIAGEQISAFRLQLNYTLTPPGRHLSPRDEYLRKYSNAKQSKNNNSLTKKVAISFEIKS